VSPGWEQVSSPEEAYDALTRDEFPWQRCVAVEAADAANAAPAHDDDAQRHVAAPIVERGAHQVTIELPDGSAGLLVLSDTFFPGWKAVVDGAQRPIHRVNGTFRGVFVEAGDRQVVFTYDPASFKWGVVASAVGVVVVLAVVLRVPSRLGARLKGRQ
jgi:hypothetical protein